MAGSSGAAILRTLHRSADGLRGARATCLRYAAMGTYYFNIHCDGFQLTDVVGEICPSAEEARAEAFRAARTLIQDELLNGRIPSGWIEVEDEDHRPVMVVPIRAAAT